MFIYFLDSINGIIFLEIDTIEVNRIMDIQKLLINEIRTYLSIYRMNEILYSVGIDLQPNSNNEKARNNNIANYLYDALDTILDIMDDIDSIDSEDDDFVSVLQNVSMNYDTFTDDLIINEVINKFQKR